MTKNKNFLMVGFLYLMMSMITVGYANNSPSSIHFTSESFEEAKERAQSEGKLLFVDFYATWCSPCKWMEKYTFQHREVVNMLNENYVPIKVDIDTKEGFGLKDKYAVSVLPTLLIFDSNGNMVEKVQETLSKSKLMNILNFHHYSNNNVVKSHYFNTNPNVVKKDQPVKNTKKYDDLYQKEIVKKSHYRIQLGHYDNYASALRKVNEIRETFADDIIVLNDYNEGKVWYRVLMGKYTVYDEAEDFKNILKNQFEINSIIY